MTPEQLEQAIERTRQEPRYSKVKRASILALGRVRSLLGLPLKAREVKAVREALEDAYRDYKRESWIERAQEK